MCVSLVPTAFATSEGLDNFTKTRAYEGQFADVPTSEWYAADVKHAYELGLINGNSATTYNPTGNITLVETITLASRLHNIYYGGMEVFEQNGPWYQVYIDYAIANGIISETQYADYALLATRAQFAEIFAKALPVEALSEINSIEIGSLPDVTGEEDYGNAVYMLYNAGILTGSDAYGTFNPNNHIQRSEVAAMTVRMAITSSRKMVTLEKRPFKLMSMVTQDEKVILDWDAVPGTTNYAILLATEEEPEFGQVNELFSIDGEPVSTEISYDLRETPWLNYLVGQTVSFKVSAYEVDSVYNYRLISESEIVSLEVPTYEYPELLLQLNIIEKEVKLGFDYLNKCIEKIKSALNSYGYTGTASAVVAFAGASGTFKRALEACGNYPEFNVIKVELGELINVISSALPDKVTIYGDNRDLETIKAMTNAMTAITPNITNVFYEISILK